MSYTREQMKELGSIGGSRKRMDKVHKVRRRVELSTTYAAEAMGVSRNTVLNMLKDGRLKGLTPADLVQWALRQPPPADVGNNP